MDRDAFINAMIAELESQKEASSNSEIFFTGKKNSPADIYRKLCFDFPSIGDEDLVLFKNELQEIVSRKSLSKPSADVLEIFSLNDTFVDNIVRLSSHNPLHLDDNDAFTQGLSNLTLKSSSNSSMQSLALFVLLNLPSWLLSRSKDELSFLFHDSTHFIINRLSIPRPPDYSWAVLTMKFRNFIMKSSIALVQGVGKDELDREGYLSSMLECIRSLAQIFSIHSRASSSGFGADNLIAYFASALDSSDDEEAYSTVSFGREVLSHLIHLYLDILSHVPSAIPDYLPLIFRTLYANNPHPQTTIPILGEYIGVKAIGNFAVSLLQTLDSKGKMISTLATIESVRRFFLQENNLSRLVSVVENIKSINLSSVDTPRLPQMKLDLESSTFFIELLDLLVFRDMNSAISSTVSRIFFEKLTSSRLLPCSMMVFHQILSTQLSLLKNPNVDQYPNSSSLWQLSTRCAIVMSRLLSISAEARSYFFQSSFLQETWEECMRYFINKDVSMNLVSNVWLPTMGIPILFAALHTGKLPGVVNPVGAESWYRILELSFEYLSVVSIDVFLPNDVLLRASSLGNANINSTVTANESSESASAVDDAHEETDVDKVSNAEKSNYLLQRQVLESYCVAFTMLGSTMMKDTLRMAVSIKDPYASRMKETTMVMLKVLAKFRLQFIDGTTRNPNLQVTERTIRWAKDVDSLLEGGRSSKSD